MLAGTSGETLSRSREKVQDRLCSQCPGARREARGSGDRRRFEEVLERQRGYQQKLEEKTKSLAAMKLNMDKLREQKAQELSEREKGVRAREKAGAKCGKWRSWINRSEDLQAQRDDADKRAQADA